MQQITLKNNTTNLKIYINGVPNLNLIPKDEAETIIAALELQIAEHYKKKH